MPSRCRTLEIALSVLAIDSNHDEVTLLAFNYRRAHVYPYLEQQGFVIERCQGKLARRGYVALASQQVGVVYITGSGHGSEDTFMGDQYCPIFAIGNYSSEEVQAKVIHLLSCSTAIQLGTDVVKHGCRAFFGYDNLFTITLDKADIFFECDAEIDRTLADGSNAKEAYQRTNRLYQQHIQAYKDQYRELLLNSEDVEKVALYESTFSLLEVNFNHLCAPSIDGRWGDSQAILE